MGGGIPCILLYLWSDEDPGFDFFPGQIREEVLNVLESYVLLI